MIGVVLFIAWVLCLAIAVRAEKTLWRERTRRSEPLGYVGVNK